MSCCSTRHVVVLGLCLATLADLSGAQVRLFDLEGANPSFGFDVAPLGDVNGDGKQEFLVSAPGTSDGGTIHVYDGASGTPLYAVTDWAGSAYTVAPAGDVNNDGAPDFVAGSGSTFGLKEAVVYSGVDGAELHRFSAVASLYFGSAVAGAGDVDADGYDDILVGDADLTTAFVYEGGAAYVYSGKTGLILHTIHGSQTYQHLGAGVAPAGDLDADGRADFAIYSNNGHFWPQPGIVEIYSGATGALLTSYTGSAIEPYLGLNLVADEDMDGDGVPDVTATYQDSVRVYSGANGSILTDFPLGFLNAMTVLDDLDGDGFKEIAASYSGFNLFAGLFVVHSGLTGQLMFLAGGDVSYDYFGKTLAAADVDGDGLRDLLVGATGGVSGNKPGHVYVHTTGASLLTVDRYQISGALGGSQNFSLDAGVGEAGSFYSLVGSLSGIYPGTPAGSLQAPLNLDAYFLLSHQAPGFLQNTFGVLDASGRAQAALLVPAMPALAGITGHHAFATFTINPFQYTQVSNPVPFRLLP